MNCRMETEEKFFRPPSSSEIIQAVTKALKPDDEELTSRTARHYREGKRVKDDWRKAKDARKLGYSATYDAAEAGMFQQGKALLTLRKVLPGADVSG